MKKSFLIIIIILLFISTIVYSTISFKIEYNRNALLRSNIKEQNLQKMYDFYVKNKLSVENRPFIGDSDAPITMIIAIDFLSESSKEFYYEKMPIINEEFVKTGQVKLYHKYYITRKELEEKKGRFIYATAANCFYKLNGTDPISFHKELHNTKEEDIVALAEKFGLNKAYFKKCVDEDNLKNVYEDMIESFNNIIISPSIYVGVEGDDNTLIAGNPSLQLINRTIRFKQISLGI